MTLDEFISRFPSDGDCLDHVFASMQSQPCTLCQSLRGFWHAAGRRQYACMECAVSQRVGSRTLIHHSRLPPRLWFYALLLIATSPLGISGKFLMRHLGVSEKAAWRILWRVKLHVKAISPEQPFALSHSAVEIDETLLTGLRNEDGSGKSKAIIFGLIDKSGVHTMLVPDRKRQTLYPIIRRYIPQGSIIVTDSYSTYSTLGDIGYNHEVVNHRKNVWVNERGYSTSRIESYWGNLKRCLFQTHRHVSLQYIDLHLALHAFRYNARCRGRDPFLAMIDSFPILQGNSKTTL